jgi:hypothetical protein
MTVPTLAAYQAALKAEGLPITAHAGWAERNRPGPWDPTAGVVIHHTGPWSTVAGMLRLLTEGRSDLPGPLCHAAGRPGGIVDLVGWHDTNHAGLNDPAVLGAMRKGDRPPAPRSGRDSEDGNAATFGIELIHKGSGPWPPEQVECAVKYAAAVCRLQGWNANHVVYHKGLTTRKVDPGGEFPTIASFRKRVTARLAAQPVLTWTLRAGDSPREVADRFDVTVRRLWNANRDRKWEPGTHLTIPRTGDRP